MIETVNSIETIALTEIRDLGWPTDKGLVASFQKTLQSGGTIPLLLVNRVWHEDATWHYEIIDGFHRYEAVKAEKVETVLCQVVEYDVATARYHRALACLGKPSLITQARAVLALKEAFINEVVTKLGADIVIHEPILDEAGHVTSRIRKGALPSEPMAALQVLTDHLVVRTNAAPLVQEAQWRQVRQVQWEAWEAEIVVWLDKMVQAFGLEKNWLKQNVFMGDGPPVSVALESLWNIIPDVDIRRTLQKKEQDDGTLRSWYLEEIAFYSGMSYKGEERKRLDRRRPCLAKSTILNFITQSETYEDIRQTLKRDYDQWLDRQREQSDLNERMRFIAQQAETEARYGRQLAIDHAYETFCARIKEDDAYAYEQHIILLAQHEKYRLTWEKQWIQRNKNKGYMRRVTEDDRFRTQAELELMRILMPCAYEGGRGWFPPAYQLAAGQYGPSPKTEQALIVKTEEVPDTDDDETSVIFDTVAPAFGKRHENESAPPPTIIQQCRERYYGINQNLEALKMLQLECYGHLTFLEKMSSQADGEDQKEIVLYIERIRHAIGSITGAAQAG